MTLAAQPNLTPGHTYRTRDLLAWTRNPTRLARRLVDEGRLREAAYGLYYAPLPTWFGQAPATDEDLLCAFLNGGRFVISGPSRWNALGLGSTVLFAATLVYNRQRTGQFTFDGRRFLLRRVLFPDQPPPEWFIIDLVQHHEMAGVALPALATALTAQLRSGRWDRAVLRDMAVAYGKKSTLALVDGCLAQAYETT
ncbi:MAG: hypothetical protein EXR77_19490 [Myxococcales bacterium]|nr:hypothetical protein [Myxococcales bacterium]